MLELVSAKGDARAARQSSWLSSPGGTEAKLARAAGPLRLMFAAFVLVHLALQAWRAHTASALPEAGFEQAPWLVGALLGLLWLPFTAFGLLTLSRSLTRREWASLRGQARALAVIEPISLAIVLVFGALHGVTLAWPLVRGAFDALDVRAELVATLSSTWRGVPMNALGYLCAVGAAAFCAARLALASLPARGPALVRAVLTLAVGAYLLGSYAVIRCGSGSLWP